MLSVDSHFDLLPFSCGLVFVYGEPTLWEAQPSNLFLSLMGRGFFIDLQFLLLSLALD